jgi:hypothetical protein
MKLYLEGGKHLRNPMKEFIRRAVGSRVKLDVVACGPRDKAIARFRNDSTAALLLIDSEGDDLNELSSNVAGRTISTKAPDQIFFMVQLMESWFLADQNSLAAYFGQGFNPNPLPANPDLETIPKQDVENGLGNATRPSRKGKYRKGTHDAPLLGLVDHFAVYGACPNFRKLVDYLRQNATL